MLYGHLPADDSRRREVWCQRVNRVKRDRGRLRPKGVVAKGSKCHDLHHDFKEKNDLSFSFREDRTSNHFKSPAAHLQHHISVPSREDRAKNLQNLPAKCQIQTGPNRSKAQHCSALFDFGPVLPCYSDREEDSQTWSTIHCQLLAQK